MVFLSDPLTLDRLALLHEVLVLEECVGPLGDVHHAWPPRRLHLVGQADVVGPHVELEPPLADDAAEDGAGVDAHAHVDRLVAVLVKVLDGGDHGQAHLNAVARVLRLGLGAACANGNGKIVKIWEKELQQ